MSSAAVPRTAASMPPPRGTVNRGRAILGVIATAVAIFGASMPRALWGNDYPRYLTLVVLATVPLVVFAHPARRPVVPLTALAFGLVASASLLWADSPRNSARALVLYATLAAVAVALHAYLGSQLVVRGIVAGAVLIVVASAAAVVLLPADAFRIASPGDMFVGLYKHWNVYSYTLCLLLPAVLAVTARTPAMKTLKVAAVTMLLGSLVMTRSASGIVTGVILVAAWLCLLLVVRLRRQRADARRWSVRRRFVVGGAATFAAVGVIGVCLKYVPVLLQKDVANLSGRVPLWKAIGYVASERPWSGFGFGAVWRYHWLDSRGSVTRDLINERLPFDLAHGHNGMMDLVIQVGIVGVVAYLCILMRATWRALRWFARDPGPVPTWVLLLMLALTVLGTTEPLWMVPLGWFLVVLAACVTDGENLHRTEPSLPRHARANARSGKI